MNKTVLLSAGGTGGHLFPAQALAQELIARGWAVHLATDERGMRYADRFPGGEIHVLDSATFGSRNPIALAKTTFKLVRGYLAARALLKKLQPSVVVGFGGYPSLPPLFAAQQMAVPTVLHEQNAVLGRANKVLAKKAVAVAAGFSSDTLPADTVITGNPLRPEILEIVERLDKSSEPYPVSDGNAPFNLLVLGGSQGAQFFGEAIPAALALMASEQKARVRLTLQAREEQLEGAKAALGSAGITAEVAPFFEGIGRRLEAAHLVICRAGASTISEVAAVGRPSILVPYPFALDHDQAANAKELVERGGGVVAPQNTLDAKQIATLVGNAMKNPQALAKQARAAAMTGKPRAAQQLTDLVVEVAKGRYVGGAMAALPADANDAGDRKQG
ncbi:undecaprenyldiphospho-muramoylpentapeptide beta-N-acetylglucosaminyltransferase [Pseudahrensia aquimaris]|uniref:UDP-N-acetylglucosamine--N-acetylmuramyl-(pentapeptide) pyrophosphoryl-undecaprenol N-acetylglucosamine transferase n=1 Tax=Pseudahrensia aquimaris TaxID=744461 RepID=A0ABW3FCQ4_9HYPH